MDSSRNKLAIAGLSLVALVFASVTPDDIKDVKCASDHGGRPVDVHRVDANALSTPPRQ